jgi:hypothetical protein
VTDLTVRFDDVLADARRRLPKPRLRRRHNCPSRVTSACARSKPGGATSSARRWSARPTRISCSGARGARSSPDIPGLPIGVAIRHRCAVYAWQRPAAEPRDIRGWAPRCPACCPIAFPTAGSAEFGRPTPVVHHRRGRIPALPRRAIDFVQRRQTLQPPCRDSQRLCIAPRLHPR